MVLNYPCSDHPGTVWEPGGQSWHDHTILLTAPGASGAHPPLLESSISLHVSLPCAQGIWFPISPFRGWLLQGRLGEEKEEGKESGKPRVIEAPVGPVGARAAGWGLREGDLQPSGELCELGARRCPHGLPILLSAGFPCERPLGASEN